MLSSSPLSSFSSFLTNRRRPGSGDPSHRNESRRPASHRPPRRFAKLRSVIDNFRS
jgi:hypothetical protein